MTVLSEFIRWLLKLTHEEDSWCIYAESFHCIHIHIKMWWSIVSHGGSNEFIWWLIKSNSLKKIRDTSLQNLFTVFTLISRCGDRSTLMENQMSLSNGLSSQTHWRRFVTHHCRTFRLYPHSYQVVVIDRLLWRIEWVYLMAYQAKLIEEGSWCIFCRTFSLFPHSYRKVVTNRMDDQISLSDGLSSQTHWIRFVTHLLQNFFTVSTFVSKGGNRSNGGSNKVIWWLIKLNSMKSVRDTSFVEPFHCFHVHIKTW